MVFAVCAAVGATSLALLRGEGIMIQQEAILPTIDFQMEHWTKAATSAEEAVHRQGRLTYGIGEGLFLTVILKDPVFPSNDPEEVERVKKEYKEMLEKTKWSAITVDGEVVELFTMKQFDDAKRNIADMANHGASEVVGERCVVRVLAKSVGSDTYVTIIAQNARGWDIFSLDVSMPRYWRSFFVERNSNGTQRGWEDYPVQFGFTPMDSHCLALLVTPSNANFENVYFREEDRGDSPMCIQPMDAVRFFINAVHKTGDYSDYGRPATNPARSFDYKIGGWNVCGMRDAVNIGIPGKRRKGDPESGSSLDLKNALDETDLTYSYEWLCHFALYDTAEMRNHIGDMDSATQRFEWQKIASNLYAVTLSKFGIMLRRIVSYDGTVYEGVSTEIIPNSGYTSDSDR